MISDQNLIALNKRGFIPGPQETDEQYYQRKAFCEKFFEDPAYFLSNFEDISKRVERRHCDWIYAKLIKTYDIAPDYFVAFYSDKDLYFFQGACTWIFDYQGLSMGVIQLRKCLKEKKYFFYDQDEILLHEIAHLCRMAFDEKNEEVFAYFLSSSFFRRCFGPLVSSEKEVFIFSIACFLALVSYLFCSFFPLLKWGVIVFGFFSFIYLYTGLFRLFFRKLTLRRAAKKLYRLLKIKKYVRAILFRMSDQEIKKFSKWKSYEILEFIKRKKESNLRWKMIFLSYFSSFE